MLQAERIMARRKCIWWWWWCIFRFIFVFRVMLVVGQKRLGGYLSSRHMRQVATRVRSTNPCVCMFLFLFFYFCGACEECWKGYDLCVCVFRAHVWCYIDITLIKWFSKLQRGCASTTINLKTKAHALVCIWYVYGWCKFRGTVFWLGNHILYTFSHTNWGVITFWTLSAIPYVYLNKQFILLRIFFSFL